MFKIPLKASKMKKPIIAGMLFVLVTAMGTYTYQYTFKPRVFSSDWFESRLAGWQVEQQPIWIATIVEVINSNTIKIKDPDGKIKTMHLMYLYNKDLNSTTESSLVSALNEYLHSNLYIKGNPTTNEFNGVLLDARGSNINLDILALKGSVVNMSSTAFIHDRKVQLVPYFSNMNALDRNY